MSPTDNPRATIGSNQAPDYAREVADRLAGEYQHLDRETTGLLAEARDLPRDVNDDTLPNYISVIKRLRDLKTRIDTTHDAEKQPYLRGGQGCDGFFFTLIDKIKKRTTIRGAKPGAIDILQDRVDEYAETKRIEEETRRRRAAEDAERIRLVAEYARRTAEKEAEERRLAAERARLPHTIEAKAEIATQAEDAADQARIGEFVAINQAEIAAIQAEAKPADMVRTRTEEGTLTMAKKDSAAVTDYAKVDLERLRPYLNHNAIDVAVNAWARTTSYREDMPGVAITRKHGARII